MLAHDGALQGLEVVVVVVVVPVVVVVISVVVVGHNAKNKKRDYYYSTIQIKIGGFNLHCNLMDPRTLITIIIFIGLKNIGAEKLCTVKKKL